MAKPPNYTFDPFEEAGISKEGLAPNTIKKAFERSKEVVLDQVRSDMDESRSSVSGRQFKKLNDKYAKHKRQAGLDPVPNLQFTGKLVDSLKVVTSGNKLSLTTEPSQGPKSDGHNNHSGDSQLPRRAFIPDSGKEERLRAGIRQTLKEEIQGIIDEREGNDDT